MSGITIETKVHFRHGRRSIVIDKMPARRISVQFIYSDLPEANSSFWMLCDPKNGADLCMVDPGFDVDLFVHCDLRTMTAIWMGLDTVQAARSQDRLMLVGDTDVATGMQHWLGLSPFAVHKKRVA